MENIKAIKDFIKEIQKFFESAAAIFGKDQDEEEGEEGEENKDA